MENPFSVSLLNDFVFCPASIYFHSVDAVTDKIFYESKEQQEGSADAIESIEELSKTLI